MKSRVLRLGGNISPEQEARLISEELYKYLLGIREGFLMVERTLTEPISNFSHEVSLIKQSWINEEGPWYRLPGTGFNVKLQIDQFQRDIEQGERNSQSAEEVLEENFQKIEQDIQGFKTEYLCEGLLFPIVLDKEIIGGRPRIVAAMYGKKQPLGDFISPRERKGAVKKAIENIGEFLLAAPPGSIAVMISPPGWSGFEGITYLDTRTYIFRVMEDGRPMGSGVRTDMNVHQNRHLLTALGKDIKKSADPMEQIVDIVKNPVLLKCGSGQKGWTFADIVDIIRYIKKSDFAYKNRPFDEIYQQLDDSQNLWTLDETTKKLTDELKTFFLQQLTKGHYLRQDLEIALGITILKLAEAIRNPTSHFNNLPSHFTHPTSQNGYLAALAEVQSLPGCNGGGTSVESSFYIFTGSILPRHAQYSITSEKTLNCKCPFCNEQVDAIISGGRIICPKCDKSAPYKC